MPRFYRVAFPELGTGPYATDWVRQYELSRAHNDHPDLTANREMYCLQRHGNGKAGFTSMHDMFAWFGGWLPVLIAHGFQVETWEVAAEYMLADDSLSQAIATLERPYAVRISP